MTTSDVVQWAHTALEDPDNLDLALHPAPLVRALVAEVERLRLLLAESGEAYLSAEAEVERLRAQIVAVQALHAEESTHAGGHPGGWCRGCHADWPCPTIQALDGEVVDVN